MTQSGRTIREKCSKTHLRAFAIYNFPGVDTLDPQCA